MVLNERQREAVYAPNGPVLVLAGAGTGKTRVLIERIVKLIQQDGIDHSRILVITFTNKAKEEIKIRLLKKLGDECRVPENIFTFHAFFHRLLSKDAEKINSKFKNFKLLDDHDQKSIVRRIIKNNAIIRKDSGVILEPKIALSIISFLKINGISPSDAMKNISISNKITEQSLILLTEKYSHELRFNNYFDYDDLEVLTMQALSIEEVQSYWRHAFDGILIDEFQDTSDIQMKIVKKLVDPVKGNIFCVGDPDQSIYGFRGAKPRVCFEFQEHFNAKCIKLESNYRSTQKILNVANELIKNNYLENNEFSKNLKSEMDSSHHNPQVVCCGFVDEFQEANFVLSEILKILKKDREAKLNDFVILYRTNSVSKSFEMVFKANKINYAITASKEFHTRKEIKFITSFLQLLYFHDDAGVSVYLHSLTRELKIGIGEKSLNSFCDWMMIKNFVFLQALERIEECPSISKNAKLGLLEFGKWLNELFPIRDEDLKFVAHRILKLSGYEQITLDKREYWRIDNIRKFISYISSDTEQKTNKELVSEISLGVRSSKVQDDCLVMSTIHQAKGLEYKYVFIVKMTQEMFPYYLSKTLEEVKEERRLAYVAITRAKKALYITFSPSVIKGKKGKNIPSIFIEEIKHLRDVDYRSIVHYYI